MSRPRTGRRTGAVAVASGMLLLGGCGIQGTDVIEAGGPATVQAFVDHDTEMLLFFHSRDGGISPVIRYPKSTVEYGPDGGMVSEQNSAGQGSTDQDGVPVPTEKVILALLSGPDDDDRKAGLSTSLPSAPSAGTLRVKVSPGGETVTTELPIALDGLDRTGLRQLFCTIAYSHDENGRATVRLSGTDGASTSGTCDLDPTPSRQP
ncbi:hypothetical protein JCM4814A_89410 [Streptomyces phaeofaciens JCM 4814]|uniref:Lipoprotein n=1 Tax=Streptomyces phaeofaciens TaxID=68254 RepID=A0A918LZ15_9ACTN|nr:hypothetical protein [Streptomyces phaeofaciens]GGT79913.1 hypothetical protein GCM10010226_67870 [Streptomyces phaeofaciens]